MILAHDFLFRLFLHPYSNSHIRHIPAMCQPYMFWKIYCCCDSLMAVSNPGHNFPQLLRLTFAI